MNVMMVCGSRPPDTCGVGDYTARLIEALREIGINVETLEGMPWNLLSMGKMREMIARSHCDIVHFQYPSVGYGQSLVPQLLSFKVRSIVTLHEFSHSRLLRRVASSPFIFSARQLLFTSQYELDRVRRRFPWIASKSSVIPIGTNILPLRREERRHLDEVIYFGLIAPRKGLEQVIQFASIARRERVGITVRVIGRVPVAFRDYAKKLMDEARELPVVWSLEESEQMVAERLAGASLAYLPFPDGASDRRGSLKAALSSGVVCISTEGKGLTEQMREALVLSSDCEDAVAKAKMLLIDQCALTELSAKGSRYSESFRWDRIAQSHLQLYERLCSDDKTAISR